MDKWYFKCRDGSYYLGATKQELKKIRNFDDAIPHLIKMDYIINYMIWDSYAQHSDAPIFGKYVAYCNLRAIKCFGTADKILFDLK